MKTFVLSLVLLASSSAQALIQTDFITGSITQVFAGEFDPYIVGDACVITVATKDDTVLLLTDVDHCIDNADELVIGRGVTVALDDSNIIVDKDVLSVLADLNADLHFSVDFGSIENGLAD